MSLSKKASIVFLFTLGKRNTDAVVFLFTSGKTNANAVVDLTDDDTKPSASDCKEVSISRYPGRIYPSLVVVARPQLKSKEVTSALTQAERSSLGTVTRCRSIGSHHIRRFRLYRSILFRYESKKYSYQYADEIHGMVNPTRFTP